MSNPNDPLIESLRAQARAYDPEPPAGARRRIQTALALLPAGAHGTRPTPLTRWLAIAGTLTAIAVFAFALLRAPTRDIVTIPDNHIVELPATSRPGALTFPTNPLALAERFIDQPLETEFNNLITDLARTRNTVTRVLPAPVKQAKPTTRQPV